MKIRENTVVIVDDHPLFLEGIRSIIQREENLSVVGEASTGSEAVEIIEKHKPDLAILDVELKDGDGFEIFEFIKNFKNETRVIFLTMHNDPEILRKALEQGAMGFILKENTAGEIIDCIRSVLDGHTYICPKLSGNLFKLMKSSLLQNNINGALNKLTVSERRILKFISSNKTSREISNELNISTKTVENHRNNICEKLNLHGSHSLIKFAIENKERI